MTGRQRNLARTTANTTNIVLTVAGLTLLGLGIILPWTRDIHAKGFPWQVVLGGVAAALGGAVLSWMASVAVSKRAATDELGRQIASVTRSVAQASGQILNSIERAYKSDIEPVTAFELMYQQARSIQSDVNEISLIIQTGYSSANVEDTIKAIDEATRFLVGTKAPPEVTERLSRVRSSLVMTRDQGGPVAAHDAPPPVFKTISCPECSNGVPIRLRPGSAQKNIRAICLNCFTSLAVAIPTYDVTIVGKMRLEADSVIVKRNGSRPVIKCPKCNEKISAQIAQSECFYAVCNEDQIIVRIKRDDFEDWQTSASRDD